jgi:hypothetical protein
MVAPRFKYIAGQWQKSNIENTLEGKVATASLDD